MAFRDQCNCSDFRTNTQAPPGKLWLRQLVSPDLIDDLIRSCIDNESVS